MVSLSNILTKGANSLLDSTSLGKLLNGAGSDYAATTYGTDFIPEYIKTTGQKRYQTTSSIMNLPKVETMFFVYFSLNPKTTDMISKKQSLIEYLTRTTSSTTSKNNTSLNNLATTISGSLTQSLEKVANGLSPTLGSLAKKFSQSKTSKSSSDSIPTEKDSKSYGDYLPDKFLLNQLSFELSKFVKSIDKPTISFNINEYNEYNRKRLCYDKIKYNPITVTFYDVKDNPVEKFFFTYLKLISNNFLCKDFNNYRKEIVTDDFDYDKTDWGFDTDSNFRLIDKISICEYYMDKMMVYTMEKPVIESIKFGTNNIGSWNANTIQVSFQYEGITNDLLDAVPYNVEWTGDKAYLKSMINANITAEMATFLNTRYKGGASMGIDTAVSFIKGVLDAPKNERWSIIKSQTLDTLRKLGFSQEINLVNSAIDTVENIKSSDNKGKYLLKLTDDPSSIIGQVINNGSTSSSTNFLKLFS